jgi:hypothetical protein
LTNGVPNIAKKSSHGQKMRFPPTKISLLVKNNVDKAFVFVCRLQPFTEDTLGGGNLRGPNIPVP